MNKGIEQMQSVLIFSTRTHERQQRHLTNIKTLMEETDGNSIFFFHQKFSAYAKFCSLKSGMPDTKHKKLLRLQMTRVPTNRRYDLNL